MRKIKCAVIGCGKIANAYHLPALSNIDEVLFLYACDIIEERARKAESEYGFQKWTLDYHEVLADPEVDAVFILTKIDMHAKIAIDAANAGKQIFMQKPFAHSINEGRSIIQAIEENGIKFTPSFMHRYFDESMAAAKLIRDGKIGEIESIRIRNCTKNDRDTVASYGGCMMDIGCHGIDLVRYLTGEDVSEVMAVEPKNTGQAGQESGSTKSYGPNADLHGDEVKVVLSYRLTSDIPTTHEIHWSQISMTNRFEAEIYGTKGCVYLFNPHRDDGVCIGWNNDGHPREGITWEAVPFEPTFFGEAMHRKFIEDIAGGTDNSQKAWDGFTILAVIEAVRRSIDTGRWEEVVQL